MDATRRLAAAERAARAGGTVAKRLFRTNLAVETKGGKTDSVTVADRDTQKRVLEELAALHPEEPVVGEEEEELKEVPETGPAWVVDPIDGTNNYVGGSREWATAVACVENGEPVAAVVEMPALGDTYAAGDTGTTLNGEERTVSDESDPEAAQVVLPGFWEPDSRRPMVDLFAEVVGAFGDIKRIGSAQASLAAVARGHYEGAVVNVPMHPWDTVAGVHLIREAGGVVTDLDGEPWRHDADGLVASNGGVHDALLDTVGPER